MYGTFINSYKSEWIKRRRSLASWLVIIGAFFTPAIIVVARLVHRDGLPKLYASAGFWMSHWRTSWESMAIFLLPMGVMLSASLITQLEYKNNTWKQVHTTPLNYTTIFFSKLAVIVTLVVGERVRKERGLLSVWRECLAPSVSVGAVTRAYDLRQSSDWRVTTLACVYGSLKTPTSRRHKCPPWDRANTRARG